VTTQRGIRAKPEQVFEALYLIVVAQVCQPPAWWFCRQLPHH
jgi:hypothetical protein